MEPLIEYINKKPYLIAAHRGASGMFAENTLVAFKKAIEMFADIIEVDVQFTKDSKLVCYHDRKLNSDRINKLNYSDLLKTTAIPLLEDVLKQFGDQIYFIVEAKFGRAYSDRAMNNLMHLIYDLNLTNSVVVASEFTRQLNNVKYFSRASGRVVNNALIYNGKNMNANKKYYDAIICHASDISKLIYQGNINTYNNIIGVYGVNTLKEIKEVLKYKIKLIGTDYPLEIRQRIEHIKKTKISNLSE